MTVEVEEVEASDGKKSVDTMMTGMEEKRG
jgi:hypothetical protein